MSYSSGEAAEQVVRMTLNGVEVAAKISGWLFFSMRS